MPSTATEIIRGLRVKLRDDGQRQRYSDGDLLIFIKNALHRLYREERVAFFEVVGAPAAITALTETNLGAELPLVDSSWESRVMNDAYAEAENINQEGTRPEVTADLRREEING